MMSTRLSAFYAMALATLLSVTFVGCDEDPVLPDSKCKQGICMEVGSFYLDYDLADGGSLSIRHANEPDRLLWQTTPSTPLLTASNSEKNISVSRGSFTFDFDPAPTCKTSQIEAVDAVDDTVVITGKFTDCDLGFTITYRAESERRLRFEATLSGAAGNEDYNALSVGWSSNAREGFFGFGAQYNYLNLKGRKLPIWCQEQGHGRGLEPLTEVLNAASPGSAGDWHTSYTCVPYTLSSERYGLVIENSEYVEFDMTAEAFTRVTVFSPALKAQLIYGANPLEVVETYTEYTGRMEPLPAWTQKGAIVRSHGGSEEAYHTVDELDAAGAALAGLWIEDWAGVRQTGFGTRMWWNWEIDRTTYPDFEEMISKLKGMGVHSLIYFNPFLTDASKKPGLNRHLFEEAAAAGYLVKGLEGKPAMIENGGFDAALVDFTNPDAREWLKAIMRELIDIGVSGWMADFAEALPIDIKLHSGVDPASYHNEYPYEWARLNQEVATEAGVTAEHLTFNRSGNARSPSVARCFWIGDQLVTWDGFDGFKTVVPALVSSGLSGYTLQHGDVGGWLSIDILDLQYFRTKELFQRWMELASFTALVRLHTTNLPELNHQYNTDDETLVHFSRLTQVFASLAPYRAELMKDAASKGHPLVRHPMLHYPEDSAVYGLTQQFMLGADFMIAPIVDEGADKVSVYLPAGSWTHLWSGEAYGDANEGVTIEVSAPIGEPAVFYRSDSEWGSSLRDDLAKKGIL